MPSYHVRVHEKEIRKLKIKTEERIKFIYQGIMKNAPGIGSPDVF